ncbi:error-prone DNA polymerase [Futiania mangrovi]|uniref:Error-prone DNA polymerase n=1 Tax=Futiania mangrovi TaxID=2959716 RepID=A0A9J6P860_9PROT|nr:error-prone DNA polymerase [Futiania mangrovii]MCP1335724.1 error-prone DNA polymerase [Futiania mangrovii]
MSTPSSLPPRFAELAAASNFSFQHGASHPEEMVAEALRLGLSGIGIADRNTLAGAVRAHMAWRETGAREKGLKLAVGARLVFRDGTPDVIAYPEDRTAYGRLCRLLTHGNRRAPKGECHLDLPDLLAWADGLSLILMPPEKPGRETPETLATLTAARPGAVWLAAPLRMGGEDRRRLARLREIAAAAGVPLLATHDALYHAPERRPLHDVLTCVCLHTTLDAAGTRLAPHAERHLKTPAETARLYADLPEAVGESLRLLDRLHFSLEELRYQYPDEARAGFGSAQAALEHFAREGARRRYPAGVPAAVAATMERELALIGRLGYAPYFLTVHDIVCFARREGILCQGRGSAANSVVCFCLGITEVDPIEHDLLFERFISAARGEPPDIDVDFEHQRREEVLQYIYRRYGRARVALTSTVVTYGARMAVRDVGRAFGLSEDTLSALSGSVWGWSREGVDAEDAARAGLDAADPRLALVLALARDLIGFPRHLSQHTGGMVIARDRLDELVPIQNAAMEDRTVIEWNKDDLEALDFLKVDILGLGMLSALRRFFTFMSEEYGQDLTLATIPKEEPAVYEMLCRADSVGLFQVESRAQQNMLPRLKPRRFFDLVVEVAIVRPGPIQGDMVHPYLRRRQGIDPVAYPSRELEEVLGPTLGVPLFQEQCMKIAIVAAGFTPEEADRLRRAMATFKRVGTIHTFFDKMVEGMAERGYDRAFAEQCFRQIEGFGTYGFPMSHAASFALLVYASAWAKCRYPDVYLAAMLNAQPLGFYAPAQLVRDAREHGVAVRAVDVNASGVEATLEPLAPKDRPENGAAPHPRFAWMAVEMRTARAVRLGFATVRGLGDAAAEALVAHRGAGYDSVRDVWLRTGLSPAALERLAEADAFAGLGLARRDALWAVRGLGRTGDADDLPLLRALSGPAREPDAALPPMPPGQQVAEDYRHLGLSLRAHPVSFLRGRLAGLRAQPAEALERMRDGTLTAAAGLVLVRQRPGSARGVIFLTLEDETGTVNVIVWPKLFEAYRAETLGARLLVVRGRLQSEAGIVHLIAEKLEDASDLLATLGEAHTRVQSLAHADEVKRPVRAMPRGRNFR